MYDSDDRVDKLENFLFIRPTDRQYMENIVKKKYEMFLIAEDIFRNIQIQLQTLEYDEECYFYILYLLSDQLRSWFQKNKPKMIQNDNQSEVQRNIELLHKYQSILLNHFLNYFEVFVEFQKKQKLQCDLFELITAHFFLMQLYTNTTLMDKPYNLQIIEDYPKIMKLCQLNYQFLDIQLKYNESLFVYFYYYLMASLQLNQIKDIESFQIFKLIQKYFFSDSYYLNQLFAIDIEKCNFVELLLFHLQNQPKDLKFLIESLVEKYRSYPEFNKYLLTIIQSKSIELQEIMYLKLLKCSALVKFFHQNSTNIVLIKSLHIDGVDKLPIPQEKKNLMDKQLVQIKFIEWHLSDQFNDPDLNQDSILKQFQCSVAVLDKLQLSQIISQQQKAEIKPQDINDLIKAILNRNLKQNPSFPGGTHAFYKFILQYIEVQILQDTFKVNVFLSQVIDLSFFTRIITENDCFTQMVSRLALNKKFYIFSKILGCINNQESSVSQWTESLFSSNRLLNKINLESTQNISNMILTKSTNSIMLISRSLADIEGQAETNNQQQVYIADEEFFCFLDNLIYFIRNKKIEKSYKLLELLWILANNIRIGSVPQQFRDQYGQKMLLIAYSILDCLENCKEQKYFRSLIFQKNQGFISFYNYDIFDQKFITQIQLYCLQILFYKIEGYKEVFEILGSLKAFILTDDIIDFKEQTNLLILLLAVQTNEGIIEKLTELIYLQLEKQPHISNIKTILRVLSKNKVLVSRLLFKELHDIISEEFNSKTRYDDKFLIEQSSLKDKFFNIKYQLNTTNCLDQALNFTTYINMTEEQILKLGFNDQAIQQLEQMLGSQLMKMTEDKPQPTQLQHITFRQYSHAILNQQQGIYISFPLNIVICAKFHYIYQDVALQQLKVDQAIKLTLLQLKFDQVDIQIQFTFDQETKQVNFFRLIYAANQKEHICEFSLTSKSQDVDIICISLDKKFCQINYNLNEFKQAIPTLDVRVLNEILIGNHNSQQYTYLCQTDAQVEKYKFSLYRFYCFVGEFKQQFKNLQDVDTFSQSISQNLIVQMTKRIPQYKIDQQSEDPYNEQKIRSKIFRFGKGLKFEAKIQGIVINYYNYDGLHESKHKFSIYLSVIQYTKDHQILQACQNGILQHLEQNYKYLIQNLNSYRTYIKNNNSIETYENVRKIYLQLSNYSPKYALKFSRGTIQDLSLYENIEEITKITKYTLKFKIDFVDIIIMITRFQNLLDQESKFFDNILLYFYSLPSQQKNYDMIVDYLKLIKHKFALLSFLKILTKITEKVQIKELQIKQKLQTILDSVLPKFKRKSITFHFCDIFDQLLELLKLFNKKETNSYDILVEYITFLPKINITQIQQLLSSKLPLTNFIKNYIYKKLELPTQVNDIQTKDLAQNISIRLIDKIYDPNNIDEMTVGIIFNLTVFFTKFQIINPLRKYVDEIFQNILLKFQNSFLSNQYFQNNFPFTQDSLIIQELIKYIQIAINDNKKDNPIILYNCYQFLQFYEYVILKNQEIQEQSQLFLQLLQQIINLFYQNCIFHPNLTKFIQLGDIISIQNSQNYMIPGGALRLILSIIIQSKISFELLKTMDLLRERVELTKASNMEVSKQTKKFYEKFNQYEIEEYSDLKYNFLHIECVYVVYLQSQNNKQLEKLIQTYITQYLEVIKMPKNQQMLNKYKELISQFSKSQIELSTLEKFNQFSYKLHSIELKQQYIEDDSIEYIINIFAMMPLKVTQQMVLEVFKQRERVQKVKRSIVIKQEEIINLEGIFKTKQILKNDYLYFINEKISKQSLMEAEILFNQLDTIQLKLVQQNKFDYFFRFIYKQQYKTSNQQDVEQRQSVKLSDYFMSYYDSQFTIQTQLIYFDRKIESYILLGTKSIIIELSDVNEIIKHNSIRYMSLSQKHLHLLTGRKSCAIFREYLLELPSKEKADFIIQYCKTYNIKLIKDPQREFKNSGLQKEWLQSQISNFQFINLVNLYSQRSYLYFNKYRIFPQILKHPELRQTVFRNYKQEDQRTKLQQFGIQTLNKIQIVNKLFFQTEIYANPNMYELFQQFFCQPEFFHGVRIFPSWVLSQTSHEYVYRMKLFLESLEASQHLNKWLNMHFGENCEISLGEFQDKQQNDKFIIKEPKLFWNTAQFFYKKSDDDGDLKGVHLVARKCIILISTKMITKVNFADSIFLQKLQNHDINQYPIANQMTSSGFLFLVLEVGQTSFQDKIQSPYHVIDEQHKVDRLLVLMSSESDFVLRCQEVTKNKKYTPQTLEYHRDFITCIKYIQYYQTLIIGSDDTKISIWKLQLDQQNIFPQQPAQLIQSHNCQVKCMDANKSFILSVDVLNNAHISSYDGELLFKIQIKSLQSTVYCHIHDFANQFIFITSYGTLITYGYYGAIYIKEYQLCEDATHIVFMNPFISQFYYHYGNKIYFNDLFEIAATQNGASLNEDGLQLKTFEDPQIENIQFTQIVIDPKQTQLDQYNMLIATNESIFVLKDAELLSKLINMNFRQAGLLREQNQNPFKINGTKEVWDRIQEQSKQNQPIKFPGIGIEQTPWFQMQKQQEMKNQNKKQDYLSSSSKGLTKQSSKKLDIIGMYYEIDKVKSYKSKMEILDPNNKNLLQHKLQKALEDAAFLWGGKDGLRDRSANSFDKSMNELLNQTKVKQTMPIKYIFTKSHNKIKLEQ